MLYDPLAWLTWACVFLAAGCAWLQPPRWRIHLPVLIAVGYTAATLDLQLSWEILVVFAALCIAGAAVQPRMPPFLQISGHVLYIGVAIALGAHLLPGFVNPAAVYAVHTTHDATPLTIFLNLDKPLVGFWVVLTLPWSTARRFWRQILSATGAALLLAIPICMTLAFALGIVNWAPKLPPYSLLWTVNNLLLVCVAEEAFFRSYIQGGLSRLLGKGTAARMGALIVSAILFGVAHYAGGWRWMVLAGVAGVAYGWAYQRGGLRAAVLTHFGLNAAHFFFFTYPGLQASAIR